MGRHAAAQIVRLEGKQATERVHVPRQGHHGHDRAPGRPWSSWLGGLRLRGTLAWLAWFALHLFYLLGGRNRVTTLINLTYRYLFWGTAGRSSSATNRSTRGTHGNQRKLSPTDCSSSLGQTELPAVG